jgi:hypothetical protein
MLTALAVGIGGGSGAGCCWGNWLVVNASLRPPRTPLFLSPRDLNLPYQNVGFPSRDGGAAARLVDTSASAARGLPFLAHGYLMKPLRTAADCPRSVAGGLPLSGV